MAIDTASDRKSISGIPFLIPGVTPTRVSTIDDPITPSTAAWRAQAGWSYSGLIAAAILYGYNPLFYQRRPLVARTDEIQIIDIQEGAQFHDR